jgi:hypothetical protein
MTHKVIVKVIDNDRLVWKYFCDIPIFVYDDFFTKVTPLEFNAYLRVWARQDFGVYLQMTHAQHLIELKNVIIKAYKTVYPELYAFEEKDLIPYEPFWVQYWVVSHMEVSNDNSD